jgi:hypothetical protein
MSSKTTSRGFPILGIMFLILFTMKLAKIGEVGDWSWWWVTAPLWGCALVALAVFIIGFIYIAVREQWNGRGW